MDATLWIKKPKLFGANFQPGEDHVLVVAAKGGKRHRSNEWFPESSHPLKKRRVGEERRFFDTKDFPPLLAHLKVESKTIVEREATSATGEKSEPGKDSNVIVTGNPGTGKSRFFLYCIFQLIRREREDVKQLPPCELVLNHGNDFLRYDAASTEFVELRKKDVRALKAKPHVIRLVQATSTELVGWHGVSVLFASPDAKGLRNLAKVDGITYIMPTWTLEELEEYNSLLPGNLKLAEDEDELVSRYDTFGGVPRFVFSKAMGATKAELKKAIASFSALEVISYCRRKSAVKEENYSHYILQMVPTRDNFRANFNLDFLSMDIAEAVIDNVHGESLARVAEFAVDDAYDSGKDVTIPEEMQTVLFAALDKLKLTKSWTYYRPTSKTFEALDAFIWDGQSKCYGLKMTLNADHGIEAAPLNNFLKWFKEAGVDTDQFYFTFVVPSKIATSYRRQSTRTATGAVGNSPGASAKVGQFVAALDVVDEDK
ncbi:hypothetical protein PF003_g22296 [Phytophthora fragariae]|nr:hypothetical protein PF003_g22296 [Phytophthora fragariae]